MQNRYVADLGDFGKYGLLRRLTFSDDTTGVAQRLGIVWYLVDDEDHNGDGKYIGYLHSTAEQMESCRLAIHLCMRH